MKHMKTIQCDVLVIGAGLAGLTASIEAARAGASVALVSSAPTFSGSSFYPGTWGFGLIGPENRQDEQELIDTIDRVGMKMSDPALVERLVSGIHDGVQSLIDAGASLRRPQNSGEREFIPCFDHKNRDWYGLVQQDAKAALDKQLDATGVARYPHTEVLSLHKRDGAVVGATALTAEGVVYFACKSCVIASGGMGALFRYALATSDVGGMGHFLALQAGARLVNLEFFQMMLGFVSPCYKTIYNEKVFRYSGFYHPQTGESLFADLLDEETARLLELRSGHGPFTSRLDSREVDFRIFRAFMQDESGVLLRYAPEIYTNRPEFVQTYFDWLKTEKGLTEHDEVRLGLFCHAFNGGIQIDRDAFTGVPGLYACGEATGGMHGADRIGGLSTANGLVFGKIAGRAAAASAAKQTAFAEPPLEAPLVQIEQADERFEQVRRINFAAGMIFREQSGVERALSQLDALQAAVKSAPAQETTPAALTAIAQSHRLLAALTLSKGLMTAIELRKESRGSHYRADYPQTDAALEKRIVLALAPYGEVAGIFEK